MPDQILVLVAEDEALVRFIVVEALHDAGFEVMDAEHAEAALGTLQIHAARIHVLFTDIQMPGIMDGLALAHHTARHWPKIALLITSARPAPERTELPTEADFWQNHIGLATSFVIFASLWRPHEVRSSRESHSGSMSGPRIARAAYVSAHGGNAGPVIGRQWKPRRGREPGAQISSKADARSQGTWSLRDRGRGLRMICELVVQT